MAREALGRTYGLPVLISLTKGEKALIGRLNSCNYLVTVANSKGNKPGVYVLAWSLDEDDNRLHTEPLVITESAGFTFYNNNLNRHFEVQAPEADALISLIPVFGTNPPADQVGRITVPPVIISNI